MAETHANEGEAKKSPKKLIIIIVAVLVLLGGGGGAAYFFMKGDSKAAAAGKEGETADAEAGEHVEATYFEMEKPPLIVNFGKDSSVKVVQISISVMLEGLGTAEAMKKHEPMVRNNLLMAISAQGAENLKTHEGKDQLREAMKHEIEEIFHKMSIPGHLKEIYFTAFVMQ
ncbi:MAG: flagellar basal body-associated FliL family protein [Methylococcaceae bacterium]|jgi:flagellar FliL protein